jgi:DinB superfamily
MNPYASFLADRDALDAIAATPARLTQIANTLGPAGVERKPAPNKWSAREIICHLADTEAVFAFRLRQALAEDDHVIQPFDQDKWAATYAAFDIQAALATFATVRAWNLALIRSLPRDAFSRSLTHPERGRMTFQVLVETMAGHDLNHLRQLDAIVSQSASTAA